MNKRQRPYFTPEALTLLTDNFKASMESAKLHCDQNLIDALLAYAKSAKLDYENVLLRGVICGEYHLLFKGGLSYGPALPKVIEEYKAKYPQGMQAIKADPELHRQAMADSVTMDLKSAVEVYKHIEERLKSSLTMISLYGGKNAGKLDLFFKEPFIERSTAMVVDAPPQVPDENCVTVR